MDPGRVIVFVVGVDVCVACPKTASPEKRTNNAERMKRNTLPPIAAHSSTVQLSTFLLDADSTAGKAPYSFCDKHQNAAWVYNPANPTWADIWHLGEAKYVEVRSDCAHFFLSGQPKSFWTDFPS